MRLVFAGTLLMTTVASTATPAAAQARPTEAARPESTAAVVSTVRIERENVFDRAENSWWLARAANALHIVTREHVVRRELLIPEGASFDSATADETARNLRKLGIFRKVSI